MVGMSIRSPARAAVLVTFLLLFGTPEQLLCQVLGRQRDLGESMPTDPPSWIQCR
jgi:hypothetical protein